MAKATVTPSYFQSHSGKLNLWAANGSSPALRNCQLGAYWAVWSHFTTSENPALVSLPTGAGKTALMMTIAFGLKAKRVLLITPAAILRDQVREDFASLSILKNLNVLPKSLPLPMTFANESQRTTIAKWKEFEQYDVVVATPKTTSPGESGVCNPPDGLFDLVFIDEAHHTPAPTWAALVKAFSKVRTVFMTATPFRRDRRRIRAPLVYHYSIGRALDDGIYRAIQYHSVAYDKNRSNQDSLLCKEAAKVLAAEKKLGNNARLLIRTDNVGWSSRLVKMYKDAGVNVETVDYTKAMVDNDAVLKQVRNGSLDGMICVGMVGEGLDIPELKIAVLHSAPRSLPFTLQFVGRVARTTSSHTGDAHLLAVPDEVRGEVRALYRLDANWRRLVPKLVDEIIGAASGHTHFMSTNSPESIDLDPADLKPFFSVTVYRATKKAVKLANELNVSDDVSICVRELMHNGDVLVVVTEREIEPPWAKDTSISESKLALHVYYSDTANQLLFEATTSEVTAKELRASVAVQPISEIDASALIQVMQKATSADYFMIGLRNTLGRGVSQPTYKTVMGSQVQAAVRPSEGKTFGPGHALAKVSADETRGVATSNGRVWAIQRGSVEELIEWCKELADELKKKAKKASGLPQLNFLARSETISAIPDRPLAVIVDEQILWGKRHIEVTDGQDIVSSLHVPSVAIVGFGSGVLQCALEFDPAKPPIAVECDLSQTPIWKLNDSRQVRIRIELSDEDVYDGDFEGFVKRFPLTMVMPQGGIIRDRTLWKPETEAELLPVGCLQAKSWSGCDIACEDGIAQAGMKNVQDFLADMLTATLPTDAITIKDHGSGEIADFIAVQPTNRIIAFYHCKATKKAKSGPAQPGVRVDDLYDVLGQACRNRTWVRSPDLLTEIVSRLESGQRKTKIVSGGLADLKKAAKTFVSNAWKYEVVAVQPGLHCTKASSGQNVNKLFTATNEWLLGSEASFFIWGS
jgi:superfamily II DNA or RNA helicase